MGKSCLLVFAGLLGLFVSLCSTGEALPAWLRPGVYANYSAAVTHGNETDSAFTWSSFEITNETEYYFEMHKIFWTNNTFVAVGSTTYYQTNKTLPLREESYVEIQKAGDPYTATYWLEDLKKGETHAIGGVNYTVTKSETFTTRKGRVEAWVLERSTDDELVKTWYEKSTGLNVGRWCRSLKYNYTANMILSDTNIPLKLIEEEETHTTGTTATTQQSTQMEEEFPQLYGYVAFLAALGAWAAFVLYAWRREAPAEIDRAAPEAEVFLICSHCGMKIPKGAMYCPNCGNKIA